MCVMNTCHTGVNILENNKTLLRNVSIIFGNTGNLPIKDEFLEDSHYRRNIFFQY